MAMTGWPSCSSQCRHCRRIVFSSCVPMVCRSKGRKAPARRIVEFSLAAVPMERAASASFSHEDGGPSSPPPFAEASRQRSAETAERIRKASAPSSVRQRSIIAFIASERAVCIKACYEVGSWRAAPGKLLTCCFHSSGTCAAQMSGNMVQQEPCCSSERLAKCTCVRPSAACRALMARTPSTMTLATGAHHRRGMSAASWSACIK